MQACPKEPWCGDYFIYPKSDGATIKLQPKYTGNGQFSNFEAAKDNFFNGAVCTYQIIFPIEAEAKDKLSVTMKDVKNLEAYFIASQRYGTNDYLYKEMAKGLELSI